ncbi:Arc-like DNA binding dprotein [Hoeflea halophila]|uniref:Arc-like DNA binding dprotein n=1 Tax=Hoeflea halophila TaxID=714899 RepID=A0A286IEY2_9HYPH|nr:Arc family DNA-binding protein [Hoeflea halophila]SOE18587.1 Arc-like DNA binding dprotein [Hoeflea halophila]
MAKQGRGSEQAMIRLPEGMRDRLKESAEQNGRSMNAEIVARLEHSFDGGAIVSEKQMKALRSLAESMEWREAKLEIDLGHAVATMREFTKLLTELLDSPEHKLQAVVAGRRVVESAATYLGRPNYEQMQTSRFIDETPPNDPLAEVIATAEWVTEQLLHEYRRLRNDK